MKNIPQGAISEVFGTVSSGKTMLLHRLLSEASARNEFLAMVDSQDAFDPLSACQAGVNLRRLLWIRTHGHIDHAFKAADLILHAGGFGVVVLDLCEVPVRDLNRIPLSYWYRFRLAVENTPTSLVVTGDQPLVKSCARVQLEVKRERLLWRGPVFEGIDFEVAPRKALRMAG
jgi:recA bacterial DNA recombination protein